MGVKNQPAEMSVSPIGISPKQKAKFKVDPSLPREEVCPLNGEKYTKQERDIWEKRREVRDKLRLVLRRMGFYQMQRSVWVYPYDCEDFIQLLKVDFKVNAGMLYVIADQIEHEWILRKHFKLPEV